MKKILIIDEKEHHADGTGHEFWINSSEEYQNLINLTMNIKEVITFVNEVEVELQFDPSNYEWVFFHDSYQERNLDEGQLESFKSKLSNYVLFSGGKSPNYITKVTSRSLLFSNLKSVLGAYLKTCNFPVKALFDRNYHVYYPLLDKLEDYLLKEEDISKFLCSSELRFWLNTINYTNEQIEKNILPRYEKLSKQELFQKLEDWRRINI